MLDFLAPLTKAVAPQVLGIGLPLVLTHLAKSTKAISSRVPKALWPWVAVFLGAASTALPGAPDLGIGAQNGLLAAGLYSALKVLYPKATPR